MRSLTERPTVSEGAGGRQVASPGWAMPVCRSLARGLGMAALVGALMAPPARSIAAEGDESTEPATPDAGPEKSEDGGDAGGEKPDDETKKEAPADAPRARNRAPVFMPIWGGRWGGFFRRPVIVPPEATKEADEDEAGENGEAPPSVVLPDNGDLRRRLEKIRSLLAEEHFADGARELGQLLQNPETRDFFLSRDEKRRDGRSFQAELREMIRQLPPDGQQLYVTQFEPIARAQLSAAIASGTESSLREVALRYPATPSGDEALYRLAHRLWEHGRPETAAACLVRLSAIPQTAERFEPGLTMLLAACRRRIGQVTEFETCTARLRTFTDRELRVAGKIVRQLPPEGAPASAWDSLFGPFVNRAADDRDEWPVYRGAAGRNRVVSARPPLLIPRWSADLPIGTRARLSIERRIRAHVEGRGTHFPMFSPLLVGNLVLARSGRGVAAWELNTGAPAWRYPSAEIPDGDLSDDRLWQEPGGGLFSADDECFYVVDSPTGVDISASGRFLQRLSAHEHFEGRQGRLRWQIGGVDGGDEPALAGIIPLGPPVPWQGRLYLLCEWKGGLSLVALDCATGGLAWTQELALVEENQGADPFRRMVGATPTISSDDIALCPTSGGAVVAVDLTTQSLLWGYRYSRKPAMTTDPLAGETPRLDQTDRWLDGTITLADDFALLTPPESAELHCLDRHDGRVRWTKPRGNGLFLAGASSERVVVVDRNGLQAWKLSDGEPAWPKSLEFPLETYTCGRGVFTGETYFAPVSTGAIFEIDLGAGMIVATHRAVNERAPGNLVWHRGTFISQGPEFLEAFDELSKVEERRSAAATSPTGESLVSQGELQLVQGNVAAAIEAFRAAHQSAPGGKARSRLIAALLDGIRLNLPSHAEYEAELDRMLLP